MTRYIKGFPQSEADEDLMLISQDFTTQTIRLTDFLPAVFLLCMTFQKREDLSFSSGTFINSF